MAKGSRPFTDEASKFTGASPKSKPDGKRVHTSAAVRQRKRSPSISAQEKTQSDVKGQENPVQASGDQLHFSGFIRNCRVTEPEASHMDDYLSTPEREHNASSSCGRNESHNPNVQASGDQLQSEDDDVRNMFSPGVQLLPTLVTQPSQLFSGHVLATLPAREDLCRR